MQSVCISLFKVACCTSTMLLSFLSLLRAKEGLLYHVICEECEIFVPRLYSRIIIYIKLHPHAPPPSKTSYVRASPSFALDLVSRAILSQWLREKVCEIFLIIQFLKILTPAHYLFVPDEQFSSVTMK